MNFIWILFAHYIGDTALQSDSMARFKKISWVGMFNHCIVWTAFICIALQFLGIYSFWKVLFLISGHFAVDSWKVRQDHKMWCLYLDQSCHLLQCLIVYLF